LAAIREENARRNNGSYYEGLTVAGSTAIAVLVTKDYVYCANAGDSKAIAAVFAESSKL
jgi:serine/threonine protein phosphatase PrpC